ncbi:MAG: DUF4144 family protein [Methylococcaceae bacterium]|jgi:hypothetical protein
MVSWPAIINFKGIDELQYVADGQVWASDPDLHQQPYVDGDTLVDSAGRVFMLPYNAQEKKVEITATEDKLALADFELMVLKHLTSLSQCCVSKLAILSYQQGMHIVEKTE